MDRTLVMTRGNPTRLLIRLAVPLILANLGQQLYGIVDAIIVGQGVGVDAFAALGACDWLVWLVLWSVQGLTQGFSALISQAFGAADMGKTRRVIGSCVRLCLIIGLTITVASMLAAKPLLRLLNTPERILPDAALYLRMIYGGTLIVIGYNMAAATLRAVGDGRTALVAMLVAGFANIGLDLLFVTSNCPRVAQMLNDELELVTNSVELVDKYISLLNDHCSNRYKWNEVKVKLVFQHLEGNNVLRKQKNDT